MFEGLKKLYKDKLNRQLKIYVIVGDDGAIVVQIKNNKIISRQFFAETNEQAQERFKSLIAQDRSALVYLLLDVNEQECKLQNIPPINPLAVSGMVTKRLHKEFPATPFRGSYMVKRSDEGRRDFIYLLISTPFIGPAKAWYQLILAHTSNLMAVSFVPVELLNLAQKLNHHFFIVPKKTAAKWQLLLVQNKVSGFRQIVTENGKMLFTRITKEEEEEYSDVIAGNIQHEVANTIEYLKRNGLDKPNNLDIFVIVENDIKKHLRNHKLKANYITILTPGEVAVILHYKDLIESNDRFTDSLIIFTLFTGKFFLPIRPREVKQLFLLHGAILSSKVANLLILPYFLYVIGLEAYGYSKNLSTKAEKLQMHEIWEQRLINLKRESKINFDEAGVIKDVVKLYKHLTGSYISPLPLVEQLGNALDSNIKVKKINWTLQPVQTTTPGVGQQPPTSANQEEDTVPKRPFVMTIDLEMVNQSGSYQALFSALERFESQVTNVFKNYTVTYSRSKDNISFSDQQSNTIIPIQMVIANNGNVNKQ